jgi:flagellar basal-body rod modification protein FlgD
LETQSVQSNSQTTANASQSTNTTAKRALTSDFETFLNMLTAQARNQDPLEPLDGAEYAAQLAQFSMVEQQVKTNDTLALLMTQMGNSDIAELSSWVGRDVRAMAPAHYSGDPITVTPDFAANADRAELVVRDSSGTIVERQAVDLSETQIDWTGLDSDSTARPTGLYSFSVESYAEDTLLQDQSAATYNNIVEAQIQNGQITLILEGGQAILPSFVTGVRSGS